MDWQNGYVKHYITSDCIASEHVGQLASKYVQMPNISPNFIYLDGPSPREITGEVRGLSFGIDEKEYRHLVSADILLYESSLMVGAFVLTDRRYVNVQFLKNNLKRQWKIYWDRVQHQVGFELREMTGRSFNDKWSSKSTIANTRAGH